MGRNVAWGEMSHGEKCRGEKCLRGEMSWGEMSQGEMSWGETSLGEKRRRALLDCQNVHDTFPEVLQVLECFVSFKIYFCDFLKYPGLLEGSEYLS